MQVPWRCLDLHHVQAPTTTTPPQKRVSATPKWAKHVPFPALPRRQPPLFRFNLRRHGPEALKSRRSPREKRQRHRWIMRIRWAAIGGIIVRGQDCRITPMKNLNFARKVFFTLNIKVGKLHKYCWIRHIFFYQSYLCFVNDSIATLKLAWLYNVQTSANKRNVYHIFCFNNSHFIAHAFKSTWITKPRKSFFWLAYIYWKRLWIFPYSFWRCYLLI